MGGRRPSWWWRSAAALVVPAAYGAVFAPGALGDAGTPRTTTTVLATQSTWYWREQAGNIANSGVAPPVPLSDPSVPAGDLAVAGPEVNGQADKETYLEFDVSALPQGAVIDSFVVTLPVDAAAQNVTPTGTAVPLIACLPQGAWSGGQAGQAFAGKPADTCATEAPKFKTDDGGRSYKADIAAIAQRWLAAGAINTGVAVADDPANTQTVYQLAFGPAPAIGKLTATVTYEVPGALAPADGGTTPAVPGPDSTGAFVPSAVVPDQSSTPSPASSANGIAATTTTAPAGQGATALRHGALAGAGSLPPAGFWIAGVLLLALMLSASLVLGDTPAPTGRRRRRLAAAGSEPLIPSDPAE